MNSKYYISTGAKENFFTLRYTYDEPTYAKSESGTFCTGVITRDYFVQNLSIVREEAIRKAKEITGQAMDTDIEVRPIGERQDIDWSLFRNGKYSGKPIVEVVLEDKGYCLWYAQNCNNGTAELLKTLLETDLGAILSQKKAKEDAAAQAAQDAENRKKNMTYVGDVGDKIEFSGKVIAIFGGEGRFGYWTCTKMEDPKTGNRVTYWNELHDKAGNSPCKGDSVTIKATVKDQSVDRDGYKETVVRNAKMIAIEVAPKNAGLQVNGSVAA